MFDHLNFFSHDSINLASAQTITVLQCLILMRSNLEGEESRSKFGENEEEH